MRTLTLVLASVLTMGGCAERNATAQSRHALVTNGLRVHEWGLLDVSPGTETIADLAIGGNRNVQPSPRDSVDVDKPVLYFHLPTGVQEMELDVDVGLPHGVIAESFPLGVRARGDHGVHWSTVHARAGSCPNSIRIREEDPTCAQTVGVCERAELQRYETNDSACLTVDSAHYNHLFYRGRDMREIQLPLVARQRQGNLFARNVSANTRIAGLVLHLVRQADGTVRAEALSPPAPGERVRVGDITHPIADPYAWLRAQAMEQGLTAPEADAFVRAWGQELFAEACNRGGTVADGDEDRRGRDGVRTVDSTDMPYAPNVVADPTLVNVLIYFLPQTIMERIAPLHITPQPSEVRRVILVRLPFPGNLVVNIASERD